MAQKRLSEVCLAPVEIDDDLTLPAVSLLKVYPMLVAALL